MKLKFLIPVFLLIGVVVVTSMVQADYTNTVDLELIYDTYLHGGTWYNSSSELLAYVPSTSSYQKVIGTQFDTTEIPDCISTVDYVHMQWNVLRGVSSQDKDRGEVYMMTSYYQDDVSYSDYFDDTHSGLGLVYSSPSFQTGWNEKNWYDGMGVGDDICTHVQDSIVGNNVAMGFTARCTSTTSSSYTLASMEHASGGTTMSVTYTIDDGPYITDISPEDDASNVEYGDSGVYLETNVSHTNGRNMTINISYYDEETSSWQLISSDFTTTNDTIGSYLINATEPLTTYQWRITVEDSNDN